MRILLLTLIFCVLVTCCPQELGEEQPTALDALLAEWDESPPEGYAGQEPGSFAYHTPGSYIELYRFRLVYLTWDLDGLRAYRELRRMMTPTERVTTICIGVDYSLNDLRNAQEIIAARSAAYDLGPSPLAYTEVLVRRNRLRVALLNDRGPSQDWAEGLAAEYGSLVQIEMVDNDLVTMERHSAMEEPRNRLMVALRAARLRGASPFFCVIPLAYFIKWACGRRRAHDVRST